MGVGGFSFDSSSIDFCVFKDDGDGDLLLGELTTDGEDDMIDFGTVETILDSSSDSSAMLLKLSI